MSIYLTKGEKSTLFSIYTLEQTTQSVILENIISFSQKPKSSIASNIAILLRLGLIEID